MKNLEQVGLVALDAVELEQVQGGFWEEIIKEVLGDLLGGGDGGGTKPPIVVKCEGPCTVTIPQ